MATMNGWVVWSQEQDGWWPSEQMSRFDANEFAEALRDQGVNFIIRPAHSVTDADVING